MKRLTLLTILLVVVGLTAGFALDVKPTFSLSGSATLSWGVDLDTGDTGFQNSATATATLSLMADGTTDTHAGKGDFYGSITISGLELYWTATDATLVGTETGDALSVSAIFMAKGFEFGIYGAPSITGNAVTAIEADAYTIDETETALTVGADFGTTFGTYVKGTFGPVTAKVKVISNNDWSDDPAVNEYAIGLDGTLTVKPITVGFGVEENWVASTTGFYVDLGATVGPVAAYAGFDGQLVASTFAWDADAGATLTLANTDTLAVGVVYGDNFNGLDVKVVFTEQEAKGFVDNLLLTITGLVLDIADDVNDLEYEVDVAGSYKIALNDTQSVTPGFTVVYGSDFETVDTLKFTAYVSASLFPLTTFKVLYTSSDMLVTGDESGNTLVFSATVAY